MVQLRRLLADYDMARLRALAQARGVTLTSNRQTEAADQLATALLEPLSVRVALAHLGSEARRALDTLLAAGGRMRTAQFTRRYGEVRPLGPGRLERDMAWQSPASPAEELLYQGLIFRTFDQDEAGPGEFTMVPEDLAPLLPPPPVEAPTFPLEIVSVPPAPLQEGVKEGGAALVYDLFSYLVYLQLHDVRPYADGRLGRRDSAALRSRLLNADERRFNLLRHLAASLGFTVQQERWLRLESTPVKRWLSAPQEAQLTALQIAWRDDATWSDLRHVPGLAFDEETGWRLQDDPVRTRQTMLRLLARCPADAWWTLDSFVAAVQEIEPDFLRPDGDYTSWYVRDLATETYLSGFENWDRVEGALLRDLLCGPLQWLGIVEAAPGDAAPSPTIRRPSPICRITASGARLLGLTYEPAPAEGEADIPPPQPIVVRADLKIDVPAPANLYVRFQLERFADLESAEPCRYRLHAGSLGRALERGLRVEQVLAFLQQAGSRPVPPNVGGELRLWAGRYDSVELEEVALLRVRHERVLKELSVLPETRSLIGRALSPTTALVKRADLPRLRHVLGTMGFLRPPAPSEEPEVEGTDRVRD